MTLKVFYDKNTSRIELQLIRWRECDVDLLKTIDGRKWHKESSSWSIPLYKAPELKEKFADVWWYDQTNYLEAHPMFDHRRKFDASGNG